MKPSYLLLRMLEGVDGVVFDFDGTLVDSLGVWRALDIEFFKRRGIEFDPDAYLEQIMGKNLFECAVYTIERYGLAGEKPEDIVLEWQNEYQLLFETEVDFFPGVAEVLAYLQEQRIPYAVATAGQAHLASFFDRYDKLRPQAFVSCDDVRSSKPDPAVFYEAMRRIATDERRCLIFEDSTSGIKGARNTKSRLCGVFIAQQSPRLAESCDFAITDWRSLLLE